MTAMNRTVAAVVLALAVPVAASLSVRQAEDSRKERHRADLRQGIAGRDAVLIGNSILQKGVDVRQLSRLTGRDITRLWRGGSASAWWYLAVKNIVLQAEPKPGLVVILFRDTFLTRPGYRVHGGHREELQLLATACEPELDKLAYGRSGNPLDTWLRRNWRLYGRRRDLRSGFEEALEARIERQFPHAEPGKFEDAAEDTFDERRMDSKLLQAALDAAEDPERDDVLDFGANIGESFLPLIIDMLQAADVPLVLVRMRRSPGKRADHDERLYSYLDDLRAYLADRDVPLIDFGPDERLVDAHYESGDHLSDTGMSRFTGMMAQGLSPFLDVKAQKAGM